jgi:hypothetical protein
MADYRRAVELRPGGTAESEFRQTDKDPYGSWGGGFRMEVRRRPELCEQILRLFWAAIADEGKGEFRGVPIRCAGAWIRDYLKREARERP